MNIILSLDWKTACWHKILNKKFGNNPKLPKFIYCAFDFIDDLGYKSQTYECCQYPQVTCIFVYKNASFNTCREDEKMRRYRESIS